MPESPVQSPADLSTSVLATGLGKSFKPLLQIFLPTLLSLCGRTNKVVVTRAKACIMVIVETTQLSAILSYFVQSIEDKSASIRFAAAEGTLACVNCFNPPDLEKEARANEVETVIRVAARDAQADIRVVGRKLFEAYRMLLPTRVDRLLLYTTSFTGPLDPTTKKYLDIKSTLNAQVEISHAVSHSKNQLSSSTSAISLARRTPSEHAFVHVRSVSSSILPIDNGRAKHIMPITKAPSSTSSRQKTEMLPPAFIPVRQPTKPVSMTRSTSSAESRPRVVSATLPLRAGETIDSHQPHSLPVRPNSATSHRDVAQRFLPQPLVPLMSGPSGPRRVPISGVKTDDTNARAQAPRSRAVSNGASRSDARVPITRAPQVPTREKPKPASSQSLTSTDTLKPSKTSGVTQPTLSQISRAKATAKQKQININAPKARGTTAKGVPSSISNQRGAEKDAPKPADTRTKKPLQPAKIPLPPSPTKSDSLCEELSSSTHAPDMELQANMAAANQDEDITPHAVIKNSHDVDDKTDSESHDEKIEPRHHEKTEQGPTTPTILSTDIFDTNAKTPISSLLASIERGFMLTPSSPLSPPQAYINCDLDMAIPFPLGINGSPREEKAKDGVKPFMFGVGDDYGRSTQSSVENLNFHED
ncbi:hypothetical protein C0992_004687 [Termitomyces sp. T32_za158]|nr:hypothetical protein C0992_004687 [Termitomyces sp. T32_za158]